MILLENEHILVNLSAQGAELRSIKNKSTQIDYLWKGDPQYWGKFSPVLFPIIGALKDNSYFVENQKYQLPRHGFARDHQFEVQQLSDREVLFTLSSTAETLKVYPFEFNLGLRYQLSGHTISCTYEVHNPGQKELLFSVGGHPAFAVPQTPDTVYEDYYLDFNRDEKVTYFKIEDNLISDQTELLQLDAGKLKLAHALFYNDALVVKELKSDVITLRNTKNAHGLNFQFKGFPYFGIWSAKDADFICLEPWCGIADSIQANQQFSDKEGMVTLAAGHDFERSWSVEIF